MTKGIEVSLLLIYELLIGCVNKGLGGSVLNIEFPIQSIFSLRTRLIGLNCAYNLIWHTRHCYYLRKNSIRIA